MISIVIPSYNAERYIGRMLKSLFEQDYKGRFEVIIVDSSKDNTAKIASNFPVRLFRQPVGGPAVARNLGIKKSKGDIIVFIDADCYAPKNWLGNLVKTFRDKSVAGVGGTYKNANTDKVISKFLQYEIEERHEKMIGLRSIDFVGTYNCAYRRDVFDKFGYFDEKLTQAEDIDFSYKVSGKSRLVFNPSAYVYHYHTDTLKGFLKQKFLRGFWKVVLYSRHKEKRKGGGYTPKMLMPQIVLTGILLLAVFFELLFRFDFAYLLGLLLVIYAMNHSLFRFLVKADKSMLLPAVPLIFLRNVAGLLGVTYGILKFYILKSRL